MNKKMIEQYLKRSEEIIGERTPSEIQHDEEVINCLEMGMTIQMALFNAGQKYPEEALACDPSNIDDISAHYEYLQEHARIQKKLK